MQSLKQVIIIVVLVNIACNNTGVVLKEEIENHPYVELLQEKIGGCGEPVEKLLKTELSLNIVCDSVNLEIQHILYSNSSRHILVFSDSLHDFIHIEPDGPPSVSKVEVIQNQLLQNDWGDSKIQDYLYDNSLNEKVKFSREFLFHDGIEAYLNQCFDSILISKESYSQLVRDYVTGFYNYEEVETINQLLEIYEEVFFKTFSTEMDVLDEEKTVAFNRFSNKINTLLHEIQKESEIQFPVLIFHRDTYEIIYVKLHVLQSCSTGPFYGNPGNNYFYAIEYQTILHPEYYLL